ncbi:MAG: hypothetical protein ABI690_10570 [Chloroflexota bacterium]
MHRRIGQYILELAAISLLAVVFIALSVPEPENATPNGLDLARVQTTLSDPTYRQTGLEHERLAGVLMPVKIGLEHYGHIPMWNPYMGNGEPVINDAFSYLFNPFHSLPVLLANSFAEGTKIATYIALLIAGYAMWTLAYMLGIGAVGRIATGALYLMNGAIAGKFYVGHFQLALSLAWPPLVLAALWWTLRGKNRLAPVSFGVAFALLFFTGNIYYVLHTLLCAAIIVVFHLIERRQDISKKISFRRRFNFRWDRLRRVAIAGLFAFGLAALQFFPVWLTRDYVDHDIQSFNDDGTLEGNYDLAEAARYLVSNLDAVRQDTSRNADQAIAVDYTYIGPMVFVLMGVALIVILIRRKISTTVQSPKMVIIIALILASVMMIWGAGQASILQYLYAHITLLREFRFLGRAHAIAALWWIVLAGLALDILWNAARDWLHTPEHFDRIDRIRIIRAALAALIIWAYFVVYSASNTSTRLGMVGNNLRFLNSLDDRRFTSVAAAVIGLWALLLTAIIFDTIIMAATQLIRWPWKPTAEKLGWRAFLTRGLRIAILALVFYALNDIMAANSPLYKVETQTASFATLYPDIRKADPDPFPSINLPHSPVAFEVYEAEFRNWGLNEGWVPNSVNGLLGWYAGTLTNLPSWAVVSNAYGGSSEDYAQRLVDGNGPYQQIQCYKLEAFNGDPCTFSGGMGAVLYQRRYPLPYSFIVSAATLLTTPSKIQGSNVQRVTAISHRQDSMTLQAKTPSIPGDYFLVIQENNFPGWQATADGLPLQVNTAQVSRDFNTGDRGFIAVQMPEGTHTYSFWFEPPGFKIGIAVTLATLALIGGYLFTARIRKPAR